MSTTVSRALPFFLYLHQHAATVSIGNGSPELHVALTVWTSGGETGVTLIIIHRFPPEKAGKPEGQKREQTKANAPDRNDNAERSNYHSSFHVLPAPIRRNVLIYHIVLYRRGVVILRYKSLQLAHAYLSDNLPASRFRDRVYELRT